MVYSRVIPAWLFKEKEPQKNQVLGYTGCQFKVISNFKHIKIIQKTKKSLHYMLLLLVSALEIQKRICIFYIFSNPNFSFRK